MVPSGASLCFSCGQPVGEPPRLNLLAGGRPCPTCADRLLESLPPILPGGGGVSRDLRGTAEERDEPRPGAWVARYLPGGPDPFGDDSPEPA